MERVFESVPGVSKARVNPSGFGTDHGADVIVNYDIGLPLKELEQNGTLVIQVKSFTGDHWETNAVNQLAEAVEKYQATAALLLTTAEATSPLLDAIESLRTQLEPKHVNVGLIAGQDVARFMLRFGGNLLFPDS